MPGRVLRLQREALTELAHDDLAVVVGGSAKCVPDLTELLGCVGTYQCPTWTC
jgi:hypothetical protein